MPSPLLNLLALAPLVRPHLLARDDPHTSDIVLTTNTYSHKFIAAPSSTVVVTGTFVGDAPGGVAASTLPGGEPLPTAVGPGLESVPASDSLLGVTTTIGDHASTHTRTLVVSDPVPSGSSTGVIVVTVVTGTRGGGGGGGGTGTGTGGGSTGVPVVSRLPTTLVITGTDTGTGTAAAATATSASSSQGTGAAGTMTTTGAMNASKPSGAAAGGRIQGSKGVWWEVLAGVVGVLGVGMM